MLNVIPTTPPQATATTNLATTLRDDVIAISFILFTAAFWSMVKSRRHLLQPGALSEPRRILQQSGRAGGSVNR